MLWSRFDWFFFSPNCCITQNTERWLICSHLSNFPSRASLTLFHFVGTTGTFPWSCVHRQNQRNLSSRSCFTLASLTRFDFLPQIFRLQIIIASRNDSSTVFGLLRDSYLRFALTTSVLFCCPRAKLSSRS
jgi:hypothetical protein